MDADFFKKQFGSKKLSQRRFAKQVGLHQSDVCHILSGRRQMRIYEAELWASVLELPISVVVIKSGLSLGPKVREMFEKEYIFS